MPQDHHLPEDNAFLQLLEREHQYYCEILDIEQKENERLTHHTLPAGKFRALQRKKRSLVTEIQKIEVKLEPLKMAWKNQNNMQKPTYKEVTSKLKELDRLLKEILHLDEKNRKMMKFRLHLAKERHV